MVRRRSYGLILFLSLGLSVGALAWSAQGDSEADLAISRWLTEPDRRDVPLKLHVMGPTLTFELRHLVRVIVQMDIRELQKKSFNRELHYIFKVADEGGVWLPGAIYIKSNVGEKSGPGPNLDLVSDAYLEPGAYTLAVIVYDAVLKERTVMRKRVQVPAAKNDRLAEIRPQFPKVEFLADPQRFVASLGEVRAPLPLQTRRPLHIDLVIDFGAYREEVSSQPAKFYSSRLLQTASLLSQIRPSRGCLEVSAVDILRLELFFRRKKPEEIEWQRLRETVLSRNLDVVGVSVLGSRRQTATAFGGFLEELIKAPADCGVQGEQPLRVVLLIASGVAFPRKSEIEPIRPDCECIIYYLRQEQNPFFPFDDIPKLLKRVYTRKVNISSPKKFRKQLGELFESLQQVSGAAADKPPK